MAGSILSSPHSRPSQVEGPPALMPSVSEGDLVHLPLSPHSISIRNEVFQKSLSRLYPIKLLAVSENDYCFLSIQKEASKNKTIFLTVATGIQEMWHLSPHFHPQKPSLLQENDTIFTELWLFSPCWYSQRAFATDISQSPCQDLQGNSEEIGGSLQSPPLVA